MIIGLIPARLNSKRLPLKPLKKINGISLIGHVLKRALKSKKLNKIVVCADSKMISDEVSKYGVETFMTNINIKNGTERIAEYLKKKDKIKKKLKLVVDIQCDEVFLNPKYLDKIISFHLRNLKKYDVVIPHSLTYERNNKNYVKIISDNDNNVLYLSRSDSPFNFRSNVNYSIIKCSHSFSSTPTSILRLVGLIAPCCSCELMLPLLSSYAVILQ